MFASEIATLELLQLNREIRCSQARTGTLLDFVQCTAPRAPFAFVGGGFSFACVFWDEWRRSLDDTLAGARCFLRLANQVPLGGRLASASGTRAAYPMVLALYWAAGVGGNPSRVHDSKHSVRNRRQALMP